VQTHLKKWAKRQQILAYRLYERDLPEYPLIVDWYDGEAVVWIYERSRDDDESKKKAFHHEVIQAICNGLNLSPEQLFLKERKKQKGLDHQYQKLGFASQIRTLVEGGLKFEVNLSDYLDTGIFLDHRQTRQLAKNWANEKRVLNLFAYTGSFTCYAIAGGATLTSTVDLNPNYCAWTRRNFELNQFTESPAHEILAQDCREFLSKTPRRFELIICDPPTFSNSKRCTEGYFCVDDHYPGLIQNCLKVLAPEGKLLFSTNSRSFVMDTKQLRENLLIEEISKKTVPEDFRNKRIHRCWKIERDLSKGV